MSALVFQLADGRYILIPRNTAFRMVDPRGLSHERGVTGSSGMSGVAGEVERLRRVAYELETTDKQMESDT